MWAPVLPLLVVSYVQAAQDSGRFSDSVGATFVPLPSGQATYFPGEGQGDRHTHTRATATTALAATTAAQASRAHTAWSLPWLARKRKGRRAKADSTSGRATVPAAGTASTMAPTATCSAALASIVGAFILSGATLGVWPPVALASPFDPRPPPKSSRQPFFEGWFIRLVDHEQRLSFAVIFGSFRSRGGKEFDQHYVSLSYLHEPKGGLLPEDVEGAEEDAADSSADDSEREWEEGSVGEHDMARPFQIAKRFSSWVREQRLAILRVFGVEGGSGTSEPSGALGKGEVGGVGAPWVDGESEEAEGETPPTESGAGVADAEGTGEKARRLRGRSEEEEEEDKPAVRGERDANAGGYAEGESEQGTGEDGGKEEVNGRDVVESQGTGEPLDSRVAESNVVGEHLHGTIRTEQDKYISGSVGDGEAEEHVSSEIDASEAEGKGATSEIYAAPDDGQPSVMPRTTPELPKDPPITSPPLLQEEPIERTWTFHAFPAPETVTISSRGEPIDTVPNLTDDPNFTWEADGIGSFMVDGDSGRLSFQLPELSVAASFRHRLPWSKEKPNSAGPEGWLQRTGLLPLHYFVHSMGSEAGYSLKATAAPRVVVGRGSMHMEANYGETFPTGWVWAQGCSETEGLCGNVFRDGEMTGEVTGSSSSSSRCRREGAAGYDSSEDGGASGGDVGEPARFVLTGGRFVIGPLTTNSFVLAFRSKEHDWNFRTTDLDRIAVTASRKGNSLTLVARSWCDTRVLEADIHAPEGSFGPAIYVPTAEGFSNAPGCVESYAATATFRLYTKGDAEEGGGRTRPLVLREEVEIKLAALEFGGDYQDT